MLEYYDSQAYSVAQQKALKFTNPAQTKDISTLEKDFDAWVEIGMTIENTASEFNFTPGQKSFALTMLAHDNLRTEFTSRNIETYEAKVDSIRRMVRDYKYQVLGAETQKKLGGINDVAGGNCYEDWVYPSSEDEWSELIYNLGYNYPTCDQDWTNILYAAEAKGKGKGGGKKGTWKGSKGWSKSAPKGGDKGGGKGKGDRGSWKGLKGAKGNGKGKGQFPGECWGCGKVGHRQMECPDDPANKGAGKADGVAPIGDDHSKDTDKEVNDYPWLTMSLSACTPRACAVIESNSKFSINTRNRFATLSEGDEVDDQMTDPEEFPLPKDTTMTAKKPKSKVARWNDQRMKTVAQAPMAYGPTPPTKAKMEPQILIEEGNSPPILIDEGNSPPI